MAQSVSAMPMSAGRVAAGMAMSHLVAGRFDDAPVWAEKAFRKLPSFLMVVAIIAASHAMAGLMHEAKRAMRHLRFLDPMLRLSGIDNWLPFQRRDDLARFADGLRKAGLPT